MSAVAAPDPEPEEPDDLVLVIFTAAARVVVCALVFSGLLSIQVMLENPMGADTTDMPGLAYQKQLSAARVPPGHGHPLQPEASSQPKFKAGKGLKDSVN